MGKKLIATYRRPDYVGGKLVGYWEDRDYVDVPDEAPRPLTRPAKTTHPRPVITTAQKPPEGRAASAAPGHAASTSTAQVQARIC